SPDGREPAPGDGRADPRRRLPRGPCGRPVRQRAPPRPGGRAGPPGRAGRRRVRRAALPDPHPGRPAHVRGPRRARRDDPEADPRLPPRGGRLRFGAGPGRRRGARPRVPPHRGRSARRKPARRKPARRKPARRKPARLATQPGIPRRPRQGQRRRVLPAHPLGRPPHCRDPVHHRRQSRQSHRGRQSRRNRQARQARQGARPVKRLIGIGVGPGDPELVTVKAVRVLREADVVLVPVLAAHEPGRAETIIREYVAPDRIRRLEFALNDTGGVTPRRAAAWHAAATAVAEAFAAGAATVAFGTLGDPGLYSTFGYLAQTVRDLVPEVTVETVAGITALQDLASRAGLALAEGTEPVTLVPLNGAPAALDQALAQGGTVVGYKVGAAASPAPGQLRDRLQAAGRLDGAVIGARLGLDGELIAPAAEVLIPDEPLPYLATLIVPATRPVATGAALAPARTGHRPSDMDVTFMSLRSRRRTRNRRPERRRRVARDAWCSWGLAPAPPTSSPSAAPAPSAKPTSSSGRRVWSTSA